MEMQYYVYHILLSMFVNDDSTDRLRVDESGRLIWEEENKACRVDIVTSEMCAGGTIPIFKGHAYVWNGGTDIRGLSAEEGAIRDVDGSS